MTMEEMQALPPKMFDFLRMGVSSERVGQRIKNSRFWGRGSRMMKLALAMFKFGILKM